MTAREGYGTTITFGTSGWAAKLISVEGPGMERAAIDATHMSTTTAMAYIVATLYDGGSVDVVFEFDPSQGEPPIGSALETITIDWAGTGNTTAFSGGFTAYSPGAAIGERMQASATIKVCGPITWA